MDKYSFKGLLLGGIILCLGGLNLKVSAQVAANDVNNSIQSYTDYGIENMGTFYLGIKTKGMQQMFTRDELLEISEGVELRREQSSPVDWNYSEFTIIHIASRDEINSPDFTSYELYQLLY